MVCAVTGIIDPSCILMGGINNSSRVCVSAVLIQNIIKTASKLLMAIQGVVLHSQGLLRTPLFKLLSSFPSSEERCFTVSLLLQRGNLCRAEQQQAGGDPVKHFTSWSPPILSESPNHTQRILPATEFHSKLTQHHLKFLETSLISTKRCNQPKVNQGVN